MMTGVIVCNPPNLPGLCFGERELCLRHLKKGSIFFFLKKKSIGGRRYIVGRGKFDEWRVLSAMSAWEEYGSLLGYQDENDFFESLQAIYRTKDVDLGCIVLREVEFFEVPVTLEKCGIAFSPYIVSGKTIDENECNRLNLALEGSEKNGAS
ncbi:MAG: hypothetical protein LIO96_05180 [Lachnospiraceae bacterium]|nr:hypothetical protein [Lachnospiraceae bacterium]